MAQSDPKAVLSSIPANTISKIELITELDGRYDAEAGSAIINIITVKNALDGYTLSLNGRVNTKPEHRRFIDGTNDGVSLLVTKGRVNMMFGYNYTLQNVLNKPMTNTFTFYGPDGNPVRQSTTALRSVDDNFKGASGSPSLIPRMSIIVNQSPTIRYTLTYNTSVAQPGIGQLDPFRNIFYPDFENQGNPDLRQSRTHSLNPTWLKMSQKLVIQASISANRCNNPIADYYSCDAESGNVLMSSINFARHDYLNQNLYVGYNPTRWLRLTLSGAVGENWLRDKSLDKKCFGVNWNLYVASDFTLPHSWSLGAQLMLNRMFDDPYTLRPYTMVMPAFYTNKNFLDGKLTVGVAVSSPFSKYIHHKSEVRTAQFSKLQYNDILDRGISLKISYRLSGGKRANLNRDTSLRNEDLSTGVN